MLCVCVCVWLLEVGNSRGEIRTLEIRCNRTKQILGFTFDGFICLCLFTKPIHSRYPIFLSYSPLLYGGPGSDLPPFQLTQLLVSVFEFCVVEHRILCHPSMLFLHCSLLVGLMKDFGSQDLDLHAELLQKIYDLKRMLISSKTMMTVEW